DGGDHLRTESGLGRGAGGARHAGRWRRGEGGARPPMSGDSEVRPPCARGPAPRCAPPHPAPGARRPRGLGRTRGAGPRFAPPPSRAPGGDRGSVQAKRTMWVVISAVGFMSLYGSHAARGQTPTLPPSGRLPTVSPGSAGYPAGALTLDQAVGEALRARPLLAGDAE